MNESPMKLAFIGLGTMGYPMAGHLQRTGAEVAVFNRTSETAARWSSEYGGQAYDSAREAASAADIVMMCVGNDDDLRAICTGADGVLAGLKSGALLVDHTTTSSEVAVEIAALCQQQQCSFLDAPVSGGQIGAENGMLTIMVGGGAADFARAEPVLQAYAKQISHLGNVGAGQSCKMVNQLCIAGILQGLSEGLRLAQESGLDAVQVRDVLKHGAAQSWQMEERTHTMAADEFEFGFAIDWMRKDLDICLQRAEELGLELPLASMANKAYKDLQARGYGRSDTSVLIKSIRRAD
ncbi:MAG: NAD(P)-dependent oxidoreductase [Pseudomonadota bacterium]